MAENKPGAPEARLGESAATIPDDPEQSVYRFITVAAKRARQLQSGARPRIQAPARKVTRTAVEETRRGLVPYTDVVAAAPPPEEPEAPEQ